jgi:hypothetical protein
VVYNECFQHTPSEEAISVVVICGENTFSVLAAFSADDEIIIFNADEEFLTYLQSYFYIIIIL